MKELDIDPIDKGDEVMRHIGTLEAVTKELKKTIEDCEISKEDIAIWIAAIGKVVISILK